MASSPDSLSIYSVLYIEKLRESGAEASSHVLSQQVREHHFCAVALLTTALYLNGSVVMATALEDLMCVMEESIATVGTMNLTAVSAQHVHLLLFLL